MTEPHVDLTELFSRDPLELTDEDIDQIILEMRKKRHLYKAAPATASGAPKLTDKQKKATSKLNIDIKL